MIENVIFGGLTNSPSDNACADGELASVLNLIPEDGELKPIAQPVATDDNIALADDDSIVYVHKVTHGDDTHCHYIISRGDGSYCWCEQATSDGTEQSFLQFNLGSLKVNGVSAIGNILCFVGEDRIVYAFWHREKAAYTVFSREDFRYKVKIGRYTHTTDRGSDYLTTASADLGDEFWDYFEHVSKGSDSEGNRMIYRIAADKTAKVFSALDAMVNERAESYGDEYQKYNVFCVVAVRLYDGSYYNISNIARLNSTQIAYPSVWVDAGEKNVSATLPPLERYTINIEFPNIDAISDLIQGVDVFLTQGEAFVNTSSEVANKQFKFLDGDKHRQAYFKFSSMNADAAAERFDSLVFRRSVFIDRDKLGKDIALKRIIGTEESISLANLYRADFGGSSCIVYNNRLHVANVAQGIPSLTSDLRYVDSIIPARYLVKVTTTQGVLWGELSEDYTFMGVFCIPVQEVNRVTIYQQLASVYRMASFNVHSSETTGFSYYIADSNDGFTFGYDMDVISVDVWDNALEEYNAYKEKPYTQTSPSLVRVSEAENPLVFPASNSVSVGSSTITAMAANTRPITEGQFGDAPLYVFTDEGTWILMVSTTGTYQSRQPVNREICSNAEGILQTDDAVLYPTERGIILQQGRQATCITDNLDGYPFDFVAFQNETTAHRILDTQSIGYGSVQHVMFRKYMDGAGMIYDYYDSRVIVFNPSYDYSYVYSLKSGKWGAMQNVFKKRVNIYPESYAIDNNNTIVDVYCKEPTLDIPYFLCTRPLSFGKPDIHKTMFTLITRGYIANGDGKCGSVLYGSNDLHKWFPINTSVDRYLRGMAGTPYKYFRLALVGSLSPDETLSGFSVDYKDRWQNKIR